MKLFGDRPLPLEPHGLGRDGRMLLLGALVLLAVGLATLYSASAHSAALRVGNPYHFVTRQAVGVVVGLALLAVAASIHPQRWLAWAPYLLAANAAMLVALFFVGVEINQARRWLPAGITVVQPSELTKLVIPLAVAWLYQRFGRERLLDSAERDRLWFGALIGLSGIGILIAREPDYGTALFVLAVGGILLILAGMPVRYPLISLITLLPVAAYFLWWRGPLIAKRWKALTNPSDLHQVQHSLTAIATGGLWGKGFGNGWEKAGYLPEPFNDFIFAVYAEETGLVGVVILLALYSAFLQFGWRVARRCPHPALRLLAFGLVLNVILQAAMNVAVATASAPTKGIPLPFLSHGSSGLSVLLLEVGILLSISRLAVTARPGAVTPGVAP